MTATDLQKKQLPVLSDIPVEDGAYPTSATAINSQENQLPISLDIAVEDGAYPTSARATAQGNQLPIPLYIPVGDGTYPILATTGNSQRNLGQSTLGTTKGSQEACPSSASIIVVEVEVPKASVIITSPQGDHQNPAPSTVKPSTEDQHNM
jgi:hypothetical protein